MAAEYETSEFTPTTQAQVATMYKAVTSPYWGGADGVNLLNHTGGSRVGAICVEIDVSRSQKPWYPFKTAANYAAATNTDRNIFSPGQILAVTNGGPATAVTAGMIFAQYRIELIEPITSALNT